jgi:hypothetical protein
MITPLTAAVWGVSILGQLRPLLRQKPGVGHLERDEWLRYAMKEESGSSASSWSLKCLAHRCMRPSVASWLLPKSQLCGGNGQ